MALALPSLESAETLNAESVIRFLNLGLGIVMSGIDVVNKLSALDLKIGEFIAEGRDPTDDEWAELKTRSDVAHDRIQEAADSPQE